MAKVKLPLLSGQVSGSIGDITFVSKNGKTYARRKNIPRNTNSVKQQAVRTNFSALSDAFIGKRDSVVLKKYDAQTHMYVDTEPFGKLTDTEREAWVALARRRGLYPSYARNLFIAENQKRLLKLGENPIRTPIGAGNDMED